jgi:hypothetical protein
MNTRNNPSPSQTPEPQWAALLQEAYQVQEPSVRLRERVAARTTTVKNEQAASDYGQARLALAAVTLALVIVGSCTLWPQFVALNRLRQFHEAIEKVEGAHTILWTMGPDGQVRSRKDIWFKGSALRLEDPALTSPASYQGKAITAPYQRVALYNRGMVWDYRPAEQRVSFGTYTDKEPAFTQKVQEIFTFAEMCRDVQLHGWTEPYRVEGDALVEGRRAYTVTRKFKPYNDPKRSTRLVMMVDPKTHLPFRYEIQSSLQTERHVAEIRYNDAVPGNFEPDFPKTAAWINSYGNNQQWLDKVKKGVAYTQTPDGRKLVIRDFQMNAQGDIFLLYTAGKRPGDTTSAKSPLHNNSGELILTHPSNKDFQYSEYKRYPQQLLKTDPAHPEQNVIDGELLEMALWIPLKPQPWPQPPHRTNTQAVLPPRLFYPGFSIRSGSSTSPSFNLTPTQLTKGNLPDYLGYYHFNLDEKALEDARAQVRTELPQQGGGGQ